MGVVPAEALNANTKLAAETTAVTKDFVVFLFILLIVLYSRAVMLFI